MLENSQGMLKNLTKNRFFWVHVLFWCLYASFFFYIVTFPRRGEEPNYTRAALDAFLQVITMASISYYHYFKALPTILEQKSWPKYLGQFIPVLILTILVQLLAKKFIYADANIKTLEFFSSTRFIVQHVFSLIFIVAFVSMLRLLKDWSDIQTTRKALENDKLTSELKYLKEQINPHFLFNTLNNLYYLAHSKSPKTTDVIAQLSQMMRYMIYETNAEKVPVSKEIEYIQNYISLEKMRLEDDFPIHLEIEGQYQHLYITPMLFITFLENAFKHGVENGNKESWINVKIHFENNTCIYAVKNSKSDKAEKNPGIGLINTQRRLNLSYPDKHSLEIKEENHSFEVNLKLELDAK